MSFNQQLTPNVKWMRAARRRLARGWIKGQAKSQNGNRMSFCMMGATYYTDVGNVSEKTAEVHATQQTMLEAVKAMTVFDSVQFFNDDSRTLKKDVMLVMLVAEELQCRKDHGLKI